MIGCISLDFMRASPTSFALKSCGVALAVCWLCPAQSAARDLYWYGDFVDIVHEYWTEHGPDSVLGGSGSWSTYYPTKFGSGPDTRAWEGWGAGFWDGGGNTAIFAGGVAGTVTLVGAGMDDAQRYIYANALDFRTDGYVIEPDSYGTGNAHHTQLVLARPSGASAPYISVSSGATATISASIVPYSDPMYASSGLIKSGGGTLVLSGSNTYTGTTLVKGGTLRIGGAGSLAAGSAVTVAGGAMLDNAGTINGSVTVGNRGTFLNDAGTVAGAVTVNGTLNGTGDVGALTLNSTGRLSVGGAAGSIGTLNTGALTLNGGSYAFDFVSGGGADRINVDGGITFGGGIINLLLNSSVFDGRTSGQWTLFDSTSTIMGFDASAWAIDDDLLTAHGGTFSVGVNATDNTELVLSYTAIPEPQTYALFFGIGTFGIIAVRRWRAMRR